MIEVTMYSPFDQWDDQWFTDLATDRFGYLGYDKVPENGEVVMIHARHHVDDVKKINDYLSKLEWCLVVLIGDEASVFPWQELKHPNMKIWVMDPRPDKHEGLRGTINGYPPQLKDYWDSDEEKEDDWFFAGQAGHQKRDEMLKLLEEVDGGEAIRTPGFTKGLKPEEYYKKLARAKVALCPSGPETPDTFRLWEALELGCVPIVNRLPSREEYPDGFWQNMLGEEPPFELVDEWAGIEKRMPRIVEFWKPKANQCMAWYKGYKRKQAKDLQNDLYHLTGVEPKKNKITTVIPVSPIPSHPATKILDETIESVRERLPDSEIILMFDGVRDELERRRRGYEEFTRRILRKHRHNPLITPLYFSKHTHQVGMTKKALEIIDTPFIQFVEMDTPLIGDIPYDDLLKEMKDYDLIRFSHEASILKEHKHMMLDDEPIGDLPVVRTIQFSARPHLAHKSFYERVLYQHFPEKSGEFIEDRLYGVILEAWEAKGKSAWDNFRMAIYHPMKTEHGIKRSTHLDGRAEDPKFEGWGA